MNKELLNDYVNMSWSKIKGIISLMTNPNRNASVSACYRDVDELLQEINVLRDYYKELDRIITEEQKSA